MQSGADRRTFVRNMVVGLPVIAGTTSLPRSLHGLPLHDAHTLSPTVDATVRQIARLHNDIRRRGAFTADDLRALAGHTRTLTVERLTSNRDVELIRGIRQIISRDGRDALLDQPVDPKAMREELLSVGFELGPTPPPGVDRVRRGDALDRLARGGIAPAYFDTMTGLEGNEVMLMMAMTSSVCSTLKDMEHMLDAMVAVMCGLAAVLPPTAPDCFAASSVLATIKLISLLMGC
jgi:CBS domain-containing protein